jgi:hypothetical protein
MEEEEQEQQEGEDRLAMGLGRGLRLLGDVLSGYLYAYGQSRGQMGEKGGGAQQECNWGSDLTQHDSFLSDGWGGSGLSGCAVGSPPFCSQRMMCLTASKGVGSRMPHRFRISSFSSLVLRSLR